MKQFRKFAALLLSCLLLGGCGQADAVPTENPAQNSSSPNLNLTLTIEKGTSADFGAEDLGGNFSDGMCYSAVRDVSITRNGVTLPLEEALQQGVTSEEEIQYLVRKDAREGLCRESCVARNGLSGFIYQYDDYAVYVLKDVLEAPDGELYPLSCLSIYADFDGTNRSTQLTGFRDKETGQVLTQEDWGLAFTVLDVTPNGISLKCTQSGGQQIGTLTIDWYHLSNEEGFLPEQNTEYRSTKIPLVMNGETTIQIDWQEAYGTLPSGEYTIVLNVLDIFDPEQVHPLMQDFHDWQNYPISFSVS